jgi:hypothetical protein
MRQRQLRLALRSRKSFCRKIRSSASLEVSPKLSLLGHYQFGFHETLLPAPGMYTSTSNALGPGASRLGVYNGATCRGLRRGNDIRPSSSGQWGIGRYRVTDETEVGLYYLNYNDRTPWS